MNTIAIKRITGSFLTSLVSTFGLACSANAEQMIDAFGCESIIVGKYLRLNREVGPESPGKDLKDSSTFSGPPVAIFRIIEILKGPPICSESFPTPLTREISVKCDFGDSDMTQQKDWKFDSSMLPKTGSMWILFIPNAVRHGTMRAFDTFNGADGRIEFSTANLEKTQEGLYLHQRFEEYNEQFSHGPRLLAEVGYTIGADHKVLNIHLLKESPNNYFNRCVLATVKSMTGQPFLNSSDASKNETNERTAIFSNHLWYDDCQ